MLKTIILPDINAIISGCLKGNRKDQELLYRRCASKLYAVCLQYSNNRDEAQDTLQDGFIRIFDNLHTYKSEGTIENWMRKIVLNVALEKYRNRDALLKVEDIDKVKGTELEPTGDYSDLDAELLMKIIKELPPQYRTVFNLYALEGYTHKEISKMLKITEGGSKSNLSRARLILQEKVEKYSGIKRKTIYG